MLCTDKSVYWTMMINCLLSSTTSFKCNNNRICKIFIHAARCMSNCPCNGIIKHRIWKKSICGWLFMFIAHSVPKCFRFSYIKALKEGCTLLRGHLREVQVIRVYPLCWSFFQWLKDRRALKLMWIFYMIYFEINQINFSHFQCINSHTFLFDLGTVQST